jgi:hypothetical protein
MAASTRNNYNMSLNLLADSIPGFSGLGASPLPGHERFLREVMGLFVLRARTRSFCECPRILMPNVPGSWDPNSVFFHPSNGELFLSFFYFAQQAQYGISSLV